MAGDTRDLVRRVLDSRAAAIREFSTSLRDAVLKDRLPAPFEMRADALSRMWDLTQIRREMAEEIGFLAAAFKSKSLPHDIDLRILRLSLARYFIDLVEQMQKASSGARTTAATSIFISAVGAIKHILDDGYFQKDNHRIIDDYLDGEAVIVAACEALSININPVRENVLYDAVRDYKMRVAEDIDREIDRLNMKTAD